MHWITRRHAKVDRIACPWLILRFIDPEGEIHFVEPDRVLAEAAALGGHAFDAPGAPFDHFVEDGVEHASFDSLLRGHHLDDPALAMLATIVRSADTRQATPAPESAGLRAAAEGFRAISKDDFENMDLQFPLYDALYAYCKQKS